MPTFTWTPPGRIQQRARTANIASDKSQHVRQQAHESYTYRMQYRCAMSNSCNWPIYDNPISLDELASHQALDAIDNNHVFHCHETHVRQCGVEWCTFPSCARVRSIIESHGVGYAEHVSSATTLAARPFATAKLHTLVSSLKVRLPCCCCRCRCRCRCVCCSIAGIFRVRKHASHH